MPRGCGQELGSVLVQEIQSLQLSTGHQELEDHCFGATIQHDVPDHFAGVHGSGSIHFVKEIHLVCCSRIGEMMLGEQLRQRNDANLPSALSISESHFIFSGRVPFAPGQAGNADPLTLDGVVQSAFQDCLFASSAAIRPREDINHGLSSGGHRDASMI